MDRQPRYPPRAAMYGLGYFSYDTLAGGEIGQNMPQSTSRPLNSLTASLNIRKLLEALVRTRIEQNEGRHSAHTERIDVAEEGVEEGIPQILRRHYHASRQSENHHDNGDE